MVSFKAYRRATAEMDVFFTKLCQQDTKVPWTGYFSLYVKIENFKKYTLTKALKTYQIEYINKHRKETTNRCTDIKQVSLGWIRHESL